VSWRSPNFADQADRYYYFFKPWYSVPGVGTEYQRIIIIIIRLTLLAVNVNSVQHHNESVVQMWCDAVESCLVRRVYVNHAYCLGSSAVSRV